MERPLRPAGRLPRPARRPLGRLRATHQGPYRAREGTTRAENRHAHYTLTRVKTGMVLARAQLLSQSSGGVVAARDRQNTLLGKGLYRKAEQVAREAAIGTLSAKDMPKRKDAKDAAAKAMHPKAFGTWMRGALSAKVPGLAACELRAMHLLRALLERAAIVLISGCVRR